MEQKHHIRTQLCLAHPSVFTVLGIEDDHVRLDGNHPLAGVTLHFDVTVREVRAATPEEIAQALARISVLEALVAALTNDDS